MSSAIDNLQAALQRAHQPEMREEGLRHHEMCMSGREAACMRCGKLRVGLYAGTPTSIIGGEPASANAKGVGFDLGRALAERAGVAYEPVVLPNNPIRMSGVPEGKARRVPWFAEHTDEVLRNNLALDDATLAHLREEGVIV